MSEPLECMEKKKKKKSTSTTSCFVSKPWLLVDKHPEASKFDRSRLKSILCILYSTLLTRVYLIFVLLPSTSPLYPILFYPYQSHPITLNFTSPPPSHNVQQQALQSLREFAAMGRASMVRPSIPQFPIPHTTTLFVFQSLNLPSNNTYPKRERKKTPACVITRQKRYTGRPSAYYNESHYRVRDAVRTWCDEVCHILSSNQDMDSQ